MLEKIKNYFIRPEVKVIGISLLITTSVSIVLGVSWYLFTKHFWSGFLAGYCIQFIIFAVVNTFLARKDAIISTSLYNQQLEALSKFTINLSCSYCKQIATVPIRLDQENRFKCDHCNQVNGVKMQFISTQVTTPLERIMFPVEEAPALKSTLD
jgi:uncharacterized membrane protein YagU involved in acid resistance